MPDNRRTRGWFTPTDDDTDGISLYDASLVTPAQVKAAGRKPPDEYRVVELSEAAFWNENLTVSPTLDQPEPGDLLVGHVVVPEFTIAEYIADKKRFRPTQDALLNAVSDFVD